MWIIHMNPDFARRATLLYSSNGDRWHVYGRSAAHDRGVAQRPHKGFRQ